MSLYITKLTSTTSKIVNTFPSNDVIVCKTFFVPSLSYFEKKLDTIFVNIKPHIITNIDACLLVMRVNNVRPANIKKSLNGAFVSVNIKNIINTANTVSIALLFINTSG